MNATTAYACANVLQHNREFKIVVYCANGKRQIAM